MNPTSQLTVITDEIGQDIERVLPTLGKFCITAIEIRNAWRKNILSFTDEDLERLRGTLRDAGMSVANIAGPMFKCWAPWTSRHDARATSFSRNVQVSRDAMPRAVEIARVLGSPCTRAFGYLGRARVTDDQWDVLVKDLTAFVDVAKAEKVTVVIENEALSPISTWANTLRLLGDIDDPYFKLLLDPGNYFFAGEIHDPSTYDTVVDRVGHHHVKDGTRTLGIKHFTTVGKGCLDYPGYFAYWASKGYSGYYSLETHVLLGRAGVSYASLGAMERMLRESTPGT